MTTTQRLKVAGFLLNISEWDRHIEVVRQILNSVALFEPYAAFLRITKGRNPGISVADIEEFLRDNGAHVEGGSIEILVRLYDTKFLGHIDFEDFLKMTLTRDNPQMRFEAAAKRENYQVEESETLGEEIEFCLTRLLTKACEFIKRMRTDAESNGAVTDRDLFNEIGTTGNILDYKAMKAFFESLKIIPRDSEIIATLRVIDINDDGLIDKSEFDYFISLFNNRSADPSLMNKLRERAIKENEVNYFGEKKDLSKTRGSVHSGSKVLPPRAIHSINLGYEGHSAAKPRLDSELKLHSTASPMKEGGYHRKYDANIPPTNLRSRESTQVIETVVRRQGTAGYQRNQEYSQALPSYQAGNKYEQEVRELIGSAHNTSGKSPIKRVESRRRTSISRSGSHVVHAARHEATHAALPRGRPSAQHICCEGGL